MAATTLVALLAVLGTLQYRWLGEVSNAERERLRAGLRTLAADFGRDFDREITRTYRAFQVDGDTLVRDPASVLAEAHAAAQASSSVGGIVRAVYVLEANGTSVGRLQQFDPTSRTLAPAEWPDVLESWRSRAERIAPHSAGMLSPVFLADAIDPKAPALIIPLPIVKRIDSGG